MPQKNIPRPVPYLKTWRKKLAGKINKEAAAKVITGTQAQYETLFSQTEQPENKALRRHLNDVLLPGIALYRALINAGQGREESLETVELLYRAILKRRRNLMAVMGRMPFAFYTFKKITRRSMKSMFPPEGWDVQWPDEGPDCLAFDMSRCYYLDITKKLGVSELMPVFCDCDDFMFEALSPKLIWKRTKTLGRGDEVCDFRFYRGRRN
jgi:hypothetical protein